MSKISESCYLFIHSGILEENQIRKCLEDSIQTLSENFELELRNTKIVINVVKNREGKKFGHTYAWVSDERVFNALIGRNLDGSLRFEEVEDENWEPPEKDYNQAIEETGGSWAKMADVEDLYTRPLIRKTLEPLVTLPGIKYTEAQQEEIDGACPIGFLEVFDTKLSERTGKLNTLFSDNIPNWVTPDLMLEKFKIFNKDKTVYYEKKTKRRFTYPVIKIKSKRHNGDIRNYCTVTFSPLFKNTSSFLINIVKRLEFEHGDNKALLFFSQSKSKTSS